MNSGNHRNQPYSLVDINKLLADNHIGTWSWNSKTNRFLLDSYWSKLFGISLSIDGISGEDIFSLVHPEDAPKVEHQWVEALQSQVPSEKYVFRIRSFDGQYLWVFFSASYTCSFDNDEPCPEATGIILNLSDTKQTVSRLFSTTIKEKDHFISSVSHELRTPINAIIGLSQFAQHHAPSALYKEYNQRVLQSAQDLLTLVNDLLDFSRLQAKEQTITLSPLEPRKLFQLFTTKYGDLIDSKRLSFENHIEPWVPNIILSDWERLYALVDNLVSNSIKFTAKGRIQLYLGFEKGTHNKAYKLILKVRDTGIGMDPQKVPSLFTAFTQGDASDTRRYSGTGIGLALVRKTVQALNGNISVATEPGKGTTVSVYIPYNPPRLPAIPLICTHNPKLTMGVVTSNPLIPELNQLAQSMEIELITYDDYNSKHRPDGWFIYDGDSDIVQHQTLESEPSPVPTATTQTSHVTMANKIQEIQEPILLVTKDPSNPRALRFPAEPQVIFEHFAKSFSATDSSSLELMKLGGTPLLLFCSDETKINTYQQLFERYGIWVTLGNPQDPTSLPNLGIEYAITLLDLDKYESLIDLRTKLQSFEPTKHTFLVLIGETTKQQYKLEPNHSQKANLQRVDLVIPSTIQGKKLLETLYSTYITSTKDLRKKPVQNEVFKNRENSLTIDIKLGLDQLDNDQELYRSMLSSFVDQAPEYLSHLTNVKERLVANGFLSKEEQERADFIIHQIKGGAARIQAVDLLVCCHEWEHISGTDKFTLTLFEQAIAKISDLVFTIKELLEDSNLWETYLDPNNPRDKRTQRRMKDPIIYEKLIESIQSYLQNYQIMESELIHLLENHIPSHSNAQETFNLFRKKVWSLQYDDAKVLLVELTNIIKDGEA
jgi:signal transduction histidine kinase/HPt (histidine-containing phosphotransfer) domain-containing protein